MHKTKKYKTLIQIYSSIYQQGTNSRLAHCKLRNVFYKVRRHFVRSSKF